MKRLKPSHWAAIAGQLAAFATLIGGLKHGWRDLLTPEIVAALFFQVSTFIVAITGDPIQGRTVYTPVEREEVRLKESQDAGQTAPH